ncbi:hypothetical protein HDU67_000998 [Dinochytrium kinnereticum]|nr:hypothetical protein HDU67_000998 [Dinochytrium kinnereticum]
MPIYMAIPGEDRPLLASEMQRDSLPQRRGKKMCGMNGWWTSTKFLTIALGVWLTIASYYIWSYWNKPRIPFIEIDDDISCSEPRIVIPAQSNYLSPASTLSRINIAVSGAGFGAIVIKSDTSPYLRIQSHFHANKKQEKHMSISFKEQKLGDRNYLDVQVTTPETETDGCAVASIILMVPDVMMAGSEFFLNGSSTMGVYAVMDKMNIRSFEIHSLGLFMLIDDVNVAGNIIVRSTVGVINIYNTTARHVDLNVGNSILDLRNIESASISSSTSLKDVKLDSIKVEDSLLLRAMSGSIFMKNITIGGALAASALKGSIDVTKLKGRFRALSFETTSRPISIDGLDASNSLQGAEVTVVTLAGNINASIVSQKAFVYKDTDCVG